MCSFNSGNRYSGIGIVRIPASILEISTGKLDYINAGHTYPILIDDNVNLLKNKSGLVLGGMENSKYEVYELKKNGYQDVYEAFSNYREKRAQSRRLFFDEKKQHKFLKALENLGLKSANLIESKRKSVRKLLTKMN